MVKRNIDSANATSTSNLKGHATQCSGEDIVKAAMKVKNLDQARNVLKDKNNLRNGSIALAFQKAGQETVTYPTTPPTNLEVHVNHVKWMSESHRPFAIVDDKGYHRNMKWGRPHQYIPTADTVVTSRFRLRCTRHCIGPHSGPSASPNASRISPDLKPSRRWPSDMLQQGHSRNSDIIRTQRGTKTHTDHRTRGRTCHR